MSKCPSDLERSDRARTSSNITTVSPVAIIEDAKW